MSCSNLREEGVSVGSSTSLKANSFGGGAKDATETADKVAITFEGRSTMYPELDPCIGSRDRFRLEYGRTKLPVIVPDRYLGPLVAGHELRIDGPADRPIQVLKKSIHS